MNKLYVIFKYYSLFLFVLFALSSCTTSKQIQEEKQTKNKQNVNFSALVRELTKQVCYKTNANKPIYVADFVNIRNFKNKSQLGFLLSSELKVSLFKECSEDLKIKELEFRDSVKLGKQGINVLSRSIKAIKTKYILKNHQVLVGTYSITKEQLILYLKLIDFDSGNTLASSRINIHINDEIKDLEGILPPKPKYYSEQKPRLVL